MYLTPLSTMPFLGFPRGTGTDHKTVGFGELEVGAVDLGLPPACPGDGTLGIVDDHLGGDRTEPLEGPPVAPKPGGDLLVCDDLRIHVPAPRKGHHEDPGRDDFTRVGIDDQGALAKVPLGRLSRLEPEDQSGLGLSLLMPWRNLLSEE